MKVQSLCVSLFEIIVNQFGRKFKNMTNRQIH